MEKRTWKIKVTRNGFEYVLLLNCKETDITDFVENETGMKLESYIAIGQLAIDYAKKLGMKIYMW